MLAFESLMRNIDQSSILTLQLGTILSELDKKVKVRAHL